MYDQKVTKRFWAKVDKRGPDDCWKWYASTNPDGYGRFMLKGIQEKAHRMAWRLAFGEIPPNLCVCHTCDNPGCVNPDHLFIGSHMDNMADMREKGRAVGHKGQDNPRACLRGAEVTEIRKIWDYHMQVSKYGLLKRMSEVYDIPYSTMDKIVHRTTWKHLA